MKKFLKTTTALAFAALVATSSLMVYGAGNYTLKVNHTDYVDLHEQYNIKPQNFMRVFYDYGTTNPYDDARATTEMNSTSKLSVTANANYKLKNFCGTCYRNKHRVLTYPLNA